MDTNRKLNLYRQEKLIEVLLKFRLKKYNFDLVKVECYNRFDEDDYMCRLEVFKGGVSIQNRVFKYEAIIDGNYVKDAESKVKNVLAIFES